MRTTREGSIGIAGYALGNGAPTRPVVPDMEQTTQFLRFAEECRRLAREAKSEQHRKLLEEMAQAWEKVAKEADPKSSHLSS